MKNALKDAKSDELKKIGEIIERAEVAMISTVDRLGHATSRPMQVQEVTTNGTLWFFATGDGALAHQVNEDSYLHLTFSDPGRNAHLSARGHASQVMDRSKMEELWHPSLKTWFEDGLDTPDICLLRIDLLEVEYWESPSSPVTKFAGFVKSMFGDNSIKNLETAQNHEHVRITH